ncbi:MAG: DsbA family protein [Oleiphilaceae bacterium]|nr:DsbA family protein [Oleiphilaceae bacterium]
MQDTTPKLYYVYDPMCAWCWGYRPTYLALTESLKERGITLTKLLSGFAPDSDISMPLDMREAIESYWYKISDLLGTEFNHAFWQQNTPHRSTYPACRAGLIARDQGKEEQRNLKIQEAYYLNAMNPSDTSVLCQLAEDIGFEKEQFETDLPSDITRKRLHDEIRFARSIGGNSFPSWILVKDQQAMQLPLDYQDHRAALTIIEDAFAS